MASLSFNWHAERDKSASRIYCSSTQCFAFGTRLHTATLQNSFPNCFALRFAPSQGSNPFLNIKIKREQYLWHRSLLIGTLKGIRTPDPLLRRQMLYPTELSARVLFATFGIITYLVQIIKCFVKKTNYFLNLVLTNENKMV